MSGIINIKFFFNNSVCSRDEEILCFISSYAYDPLIFPHCSCNYVAQSFMFTYPYTLSTFFLHSVCHCNLDKNIFLKCLLYKGSEEFLLLEKNNSPDTDCWPFFPFLCALFCSFSLAKIAYIFIYCNKNKALLLDIFHKFVLISNLIDTYCTCNGGSLQ